jgi:hypothetical protein
MSENCRNPARETTHTENIFGSANQNKGFHMNQSPSLNIMDDLDETEDAKRKA